MIQYINIPAPSTGGGFDLTLAQSQTRSVYLSSSAVFTATTDTAGVTLTNAEWYEDNVYIGDTFSCGDVILQVTQAREPCWKLALKFKQKKLVLWVISSGYTGWYMRVLQQGEISAGMPLTRVEQGCTDWSVRHCNQLYHAKKLNRDKLQSVLACAALSESWRVSFTKRLAYYDQHATSAGD